MEWRTLITAQERISGAETTSIGIQDCYCSQAGRSKNKGRESHQKQWWIQKGNEGTSIGQIFVQVYKTIVKNLKSLLASGRTK